MSIKILTQNSIQVTNIDGARENNFTAGNRSGIVKGAFNEGNFFSASSNVIALDSCELLISGHRVVIDSAESITLNNRPSTNTRYSFVSEIVVNDASTPSFRLFIQSANTELRQDNLFTTTNGAGTYQVEIGKFTLTTSGTITDVIRTIDVITGGKGDGDTAVINIGNVTTTTLEAGMNAEVDIGQRFDELTKTTYTDFNFSIPKGDRGKTGETGDLGLYELDYELPTEIGASTDVPSSAFPSGFPLTEGSGQLLLAKNGVIGSYGGFSWDSGGGFVTTEINLNGEQGEKGEKGDTAITVSIGDVITAEPETNASVTNSGTSTDLILDFVIPRGKVGATFEYDESTKTLNIITE